MSETVTLPFPARPRNRSIEARRAARVEKAVRERRIVDSLNRGVSAAEIAAREGVTEKRMRAAVREILARRMPEAPADYVALQLGRLNEALLVAYSAMSGANIRAVECVVRIVREMDRYHGFAAAGRRVARNGRAMEAEAATDGSPPALQATEESRQRAPIDALTAAASPISAPPGQGEAPAAPLGERPAAVSERVEGTEVSPGPSVAALTDGTGADLYEAETRPCERPLDQAQGETTHENVGSAPVPGPLVCEPVPAAGRVDGADALQSDRPHLAPEVSERTENAPGESLSLEATGPDVNPVWTRQREPGEAIPQSVEEPVIGGLLPSPAFPAAASNGGAAARPQMAPQDPESIECAPENDMRAGLPDDRNAVAAPGHAPGGEAPPQDAPGPELAHRSQNPPEPFEIAPVITVRVPSETPGLFRVVKMRMTRNGIMACA